MLLIQVGSNTVQAPSQALIPDHIAEPHRGRVSGLKAMLDIVAFVVGRLAAGLLPGFAPRWGSRAGPGCGHGALGGARRGPGRDGPGRRGGEAASVERPLGVALRCSFAVDLRAHPGFGWWFANRLLLWAGYLILNTYLLLFVIAVLAARPRPRS